MQGRPVKPFSVKHAGDASTERPKDPVGKRLVFSELWGDEPHPACPEQRIAYPETVKVVEVRTRILDVGKEEDNEFLAELELSSERLGRYEIVGEPKWRFVVEPVPTWYALVRYRVYRFKQLPGEEKNER